MDTSAVSLFLSEFIELGRVFGIYCFPRQKNIESLLELGITAKERQDIILSLIPDDYIDGPLQNMIPELNGDVWIFGKTFGTNEIYIKICINVIILANGEKRRCVCISFHKADYPLKYRFANEKNNR